MRKEYRILEEDDNFFIQVKVYNDEQSFIEAILATFFILEKNYTWDIVYGKVYSTLEEAKLNVCELRKKDLRKKSIKYHQA